VTDGSTKKQDLHISGSIDKCRLTIKKLLASKQINASGLAREIHLPQPTIHRLLTGKTEDPKLSTLTLIADYFSITLDQLLGNTKTILGANKPPQSIPIISWQEAAHIENTLANQHHKKWLSIADMQISASSFGLISKKSMEPMFHAGSSLIVDTQAIQCDGDIVIVHYANTSEATLRKIVLDGPTQEVHSLFNNSVCDKLTKNIKIIGVVTQMRYSFK